MSLIGLKYNEISLSLFCTVISVTLIKFKKCKIANIINYQYWEQFCLYLYIVVGGCTVACRQYKPVKT